MLIKKVVIAAAGEGTRMLHLTTNKSKHLIRVRKRPFLAYLLDNLFLAGYRELILVVGYKEELIGEFLKKYKPPLKSLRPSQYNIRMVSQYAILGPKNKIYGTACPLKCVKDIVGKSKFIYLCGDNLYSVRDLKDININGKYNYIAGIHRKNPGKYGVLIEEDGLLKKVVEKPKDYVGNLTNTGLYKFNPEVFDKLDKIKKSSRGEYEITDAINLLAKDKKMKIQKINDFWLDFGNPADIIKLSCFLGSFKKFKKLFWQNRHFDIISHRSRDVVEKAVEFIKRGQVVVSPTDTVYGFLADATNENAVKKIFDIKERSKKKPIPIFVKDIEMAKKLAVIDEKQKHFLNEVWPGKITVILKRKERCGLSKLLFGKESTIGLRVPDSKLVTDIIKKFGKPVTSTSANLSGKGPLSDIKEVLEQFEKHGAKPDLVLSAGKLPSSPSSIVIDLTKEKPQILRP
ncbi:threonylcarbamoyl-AMP synthase [Patescibacteria group bacterium]|nr:threonylcarbamoyl-AMP synthase [Patescibacteria group bacterium]